MQEIIMPFAGLINTSSDKAYSCKPYSCAYLQKRLLNLDHSKSAQCFPAELTEKESENLKRRFDPVILKYATSKPVVFRPYSPEFYQLQQLERQSCLESYLHHRDIVAASWDNKSESGRLDDWQLYQETKDANKLIVSDPNPFYASLTIYDQDVIVRTKHADHCKSKIRGKRGVIKVLSPDSRKRFKLHLRNIKEGSLNLFVTLTYGAEYPADGKIVKRHLKSMRDWMLKQGVSKGVWFLEFQKRGAPHFHFFIEGNYTLSSAKVAAAWARRIKQYLPTPDSFSKLMAVHQGQVKNGRPCVEYVKKPHALSYYGTKYATKSHQKQVPSEYENVGRFWGYWGEAKPKFQVNVYRGLYPVQALKTLLMSWRFSWKMQRDGFITENDMKERSSGILWGGAQVLDELLDAAEFCPF